MESVCSVIKIPIKTKQLVWDIANIAKTMVLLITLQSFIPNAINVGVGMQLISNFSKEFLSFGIHSIV